MRLTKRMEDGSYVAIITKESEDGSAVNYQIVQKLGKYEDQFEDPDMLKALTFCCCTEKNIKE